MINNSSLKGLSIKRIVHYLKPRVLFVLSLMTDIFKMIFLHLSSSICKFPFFKINKYKRISLWSKTKLLSAFCSSQWGWCQEKCTEGKVLAIQTATFICFLCLYVCKNRSHPFSNFYRIVKSCQRKARKRISILCMFIIEAELCLTFSLQQTSEIIKFIQRPSILNELQKESCNT